MPETLAQNTHLYIFTYNNVAIINWKNDSNSNYLDYPFFKVLSTSTCTVGYINWPMINTGEIKSYLKVISSKSLVKDIFWSAEDRREQGGMMLMQNNDAGKWGAT